MKYTNKISVQTELQEQTTQHNVSSDHLTTQNFCELNCAYYRENTIREHFEADTAVFARPMPMQLPVMGKAKLNLSTYYVPFRVLSPQFNAFITRTPHLPANSLNEMPILVEEMPYMYASTPFRALTVDQSTGYNLTTTGTATNFDFIDEAGTYYLLTADGRYFVKILNQLGYQIIPVKEPKTDEKIDVMKILAWAKVYIDWYANSQYVDQDTAYIEIQRLLNYDEDTAHVLTTSELIAIIMRCRYNTYEPDYFTSAYDNPAAPNEINTAWGDISIKDITDEYGELVTTTQSNGTATIQKQIDGQQDFITNITQYAIKSLQALQDMATRYALSGTRAVDRYAARFGIVLSAEKMKRSQFYGTQTTPMQFGSIYSTAATADATLGDYAGSGIINSEQGEHKHIEMDLEEYGVIIQVSTIVPIISYVQGYDRMNLKRTPEQYFNGQFDQLGNQAIFTGELLIGVDGRQPQGTKAALNTIFGYIPRQAHMKIGHDIMSGDLRRTYSMNATAGAWHLNRMFDEFRTTLLVHNPDFTKAGDSEQYSRIFDNTQLEDGDKFVVLYQKAAIANMHAKALYDTYDFESEGKQMIMDTLTAKKQ